MHKLIGSLNLRTDRLSASFAKIDVKKRSLSQVHSSYCLDSGVDVNGVTNISVLIDSLRSIFSQLNNSLSQAGLNNISVLIDSVFVKKVISRAAIPLLERGSKIITTSDIKKVSSFAKAFVQRLDEELVYSYPLKFRVDDQIVTKDPLGLYAHKLEVELLCLFTSRNLLDNITYALKCAGLEINSFSYAPLSLSYNIEEEKRKRSIFINLGRHSTDLLFYKDGFLEDIEILRFGSQDITAALSKEFGVSVEFAQELKDAHVRLDNVETEEDVLIKNLDGYQSIKRSRINAVAYEMLIGQFKEIKDRLLKYKDLISENTIFVAADDVLLDGFLELFSNTINSPVQMLAPGNKVKTVYKGHPHIYLPCLGALNFTLFDYQKDGALSLSLSGKKFLRKGLTYLRELYQEYF